MAHENVSAYRAATREEQCAKACDFMREFKEVRVAWFSGIVTWVFDESYAGGTHELEDPRARHRVWHQLTRRA